MYQLRNMTTVKNLFNDLAKEFAVESGSAHEETRTYYDTFDWRLFYNGYAMHRIGNTIYLKSFKTDQLVNSVEISGEANDLRHWWNFPEGEYQHKLKALLGVRALLLLGEIQLQTQLYSIMNKDLKVITRIELIKLNTSAKKRHYFLHVRAVRGYKSATVRVENIVRKFASAFPHSNVFMAFMNAASLEPGDYTSRFNSKLNHEMTTAQAMKTILRQLLTVIRKNEHGLINDFDTEFLHDFRVAIRRTRSALSQIKGVFPEKLIVRYKNKFAEVGKATNRMRDLDVYLLKKSAYKNILPPNLRPGVDALFEKFADEKIEEHERIVKLLRSASYKNLIRSWSAFLKETEDKTNHSNPTASERAQSTAKKIIFKKYNKILKSGGKINVQSEDEDLHQLRIECKKLRYLLEFFSSLFPAHAIAILITQLKKIQDNLGNFNDLSIQQENLAYYLDELKTARKESSITWAAIGGLITQLHDKQAAVRTQFSQTFAEFSKTENAKLYRKLFNSKISTD